MTTRRDLLLVALGGFAASLTSFARQPAKVPRIGYLDGVSADLDKLRGERLRTGLRDLGYVQGKSIVIESRWAEGKYERLPGLAAQLVQMKVDVIVAAGTNAIKAAQQATATIPIVMVGTGDPVASGFVASLARPGGNVTGLSNINTDLSGKYLELLRVAIPKLTRVAVLLNPGNPNHLGLHLPRLQAAAKAVGTDVSPIHLSSVNQIDVAFGKIREARAGALIVLADGVLFTFARRIAELAMEQRLPTMFATRDHVEGGGLMSYGQNIGDHFHQAATYVDKILKGAKPRDLPIEQSTKFELVINLKTAKAIGLAIPQNLLFRADRVIE